MEKPRDINAVIAGYKKGLKKIDLLAGIYDPRKIDESHPLWDHIDKTVKIGKKGDKKAKTYLSSAAVVFDDRTYNFHLFPNDADLLSKKDNSDNSLNNEYKKLHKALKEKLKEALENTALLNTYKISANLCPFVRMKKFEEKAKEANYEIDSKVSSDDVGIFNTYVSLKRNDNKEQYYIHLMRFFCDEKLVVGCTLCAIQFHKETSHINIGGVCYPQTDNDFDFNTNSLGHICYNPPVEWPNKNGDWDNQIEEIVGRFLDFVKNNADFISNPERNKEGFGKKYLKKYKSVENS